eukprot:GHVQ01036379.1.p1 GENE.GHVQ01036379.1~~GHVQ01036379.1.p1  ORF type:complete len:370 (+),score=81.38 GHVQ01036379.1:423-1532(+)
MPPKKDAKADKGQAKSELKAKQKVAEDKTFGLKNKNKSKAVQKFIKGVTSSVQGPQKGGDAQTAAKKLAEKDDKKKSAQQAALLASLFKGTENIKKLSVDDGPGGKAYDPKLSREDQKISLYQDQRQQKDDMALWDIERLQAVIDAKHSASNANATDIVCKFFLDAVEKKQYGWFWICPNGGTSCKYRHCLPPGYVLKSSVEEEDDEEEPEPLEDIIERERLALPVGGTPVTLETLTAWKEKKENERLAAVEQQRQAEAKRTGGRGLGVLTGRDLFAYDPSLFVDDEGAASEDEYAEDEEAYQATVEANQAARNSASAEEQVAKGTEVEPEEEEENTKREGDEVGAINEQLFLNGEDVNLPDDLDALDD